MDNWLRPDVVSTGFIKYSDDGKYHHITGDEWVKDILSPNLNVTVPFEIRKLFEVARGTMAYGFFFYPTYTLAQQQLFRILEAAISHKCKEIRAPKNIKTFNDKINYLTEIQIITEEENEIWHAARSLRNSASHPEAQTIFPPTITLLIRTTEIINSLYK